MSVETLGTNEPRLDLGTRRSRQRAWLTKRITALRVPSGRPGRTVPGSQRAEDGEGTDRGRRGDEEGTDRGRRGTSLVDSGAEVWRSLTFACFSETKSGCTLFVSMCL